MSIENFSLRIRFSKSHLLWTPDSDGKLGNYYSAPFTFEQESRGRSKFHVAKCSRRSVLINSDVISCVPYTAVRWKQYIQLFT